MEKTVLVVDDSSAMRALLAMTLRTAGFSVVEARDGREALERLDAGPVDVIVSDCIMPVMDGISLVREIKQRPDLQGIPIIMLTTESQGSQIQEGRALGIQAWIVKPFKPEKFIEAVRRVCRA